VNLYYYAISALAVGRELLTLEDLGNIILWSTCRYPPTDSVTSQKTYILDINVRTPGLTKWVMVC
jgi:hypothetical protein